MVSIISVNYNGLELSSRMIESLMENIHSVPYEIIVVDNGSKEDEASILQQRFPQIKAIRSEKNLGFAGGNNLALPYAQGDYLFFLNNDTEILSDNLDSLCRVFDEHPDVGLVCPKICFFFDKSIIQYAGYTPMRGFRMKNEMIGYGCKDDVSFDQEGYTAFAHGAAMMASRKALEEVGPMPEVYFLYYEELDWCKRFERKGWRIYYQPRCTIYHKDSMTTRRHGPVFTYYMTRSRLIFASRNISGAQRTFSILFTRYIASFKSILLNLIHGRSDSAKAVIKANRDFRQLKKEGRL